jgi:hypothetical protein
MTRQAERVRQGIDIRRSSPTKQGWWTRLRRAVVPSVLFGGALAGAAFGVSQIGLDTALRIAGAVALLVIALGVAAVGALAMMLRRRLAELRHLPDLGRPYVTNHEGGLVTALSRDSAGNVVLEVTSKERQTIVLDDNGAPEHMTADGATIVQLPVPGSSDAAPEVLDRLEVLFTQNVPVRLESRGVVALTGPVLNSWRLEAADGLVVTSRA